MKVYRNRHHLVSLPTKHVRTLLYLIAGEDTGLEPEKIVECGDQIKEVLTIELASAELDMSRRCASCGDETGVGVNQPLGTGCCGKCADDYNTNPPDRGRTRLNRRRVSNGLDPITWDEYRAMGDPADPSEAAPWRGGTTRGRAEAVSDEMRDS